MRSGALLVILLAVATALTTGCCIQKTDLALEGQVLDCAKEPVIGASVSLSSSQGTQKTATDVSGHFRVPSVLVCQPYDIRIDAAGFESLVVRQARVTRMPSTFVMSALCGRELAVFYSADSDGRLRREDANQASVTLSASELSEEPAVWRAIFADLIASEREGADTVFLEVGFHSSYPQDSRLVGELAGGYPKAYPVPKATLESEEIFDPQEGGNGIKFYIVGLTFETPTRVFARAGSYISLVGGGGIDYLVEKKRGRWVVTIKEHTWVS